jgi:pSer/pThr/pTyr-binding forkhead associated (FHA) protein
LLQASVTLGRNSNLAVFIAPENKEVSRTHAIIRQTPVGAVIRDAGSTNGTWLNGRKLSENEEVALKHNDVLILGKWSNGKAGEQSVEFRYLSHLDMLPLLTLPEYEETIGIRAIQDKGEGDELR